MKRLFLLCLACFFTAPAGAQPAPVCGAKDYELIFRLSEPKAGSASLWAAAHGEKDHDERFVSGMAAPDFKVITAGESLAADGVETNLLVAQIDHRGRADWQRLYAIDGLRDAVKILPHEKGFLVAANIRTEQNRDGIWLGTFDKAGQFLVKNIISDSKGNLEARDIVPMPKSGYKMAATFTPADKTATPSARIYTLDAKAGVQTQKSYITGVENRIIGIAPAEDGNWLAAGYAAGADGRRNGWVMKLDADGTIIWQRQYPRGKGAQFEAAALYPNGKITVAGQAEPADDDGNIAGWLMLLNGENGEIEWQRYYTGAGDYNGRALQVSDDGVISLMLNVAAAPVNFVRLLSVAPEGFLMASDAYFNGNGAQGKQMTLGPRSERIIIGGSDIVIQGEVKPGSKEPPPSSRSSNGWIVAAPKARRYEDPCAKPAEKLAQ